MAAEPAGRGSVLQRTFRSTVGVIVLSVAFVLTGAAIAFPPSLSFASPAAAVGKTTSVPIPLGKACEWAYPGLASGNVSGTGYSLVCLGKKRQVLGGSRSRTASARGAPTPGIPAAGICRFRRWSSTCGNARLRRRADRGPAMGRCRFRWARRASGPIRASPTARTPETRTRSSAWARTARYSAASAARTASPRGALIPVTPTAGACPMPRC